MSTATKTLDIAALFAIARLQVRGTATKEIAAKYGTSEEELLEFLDIHRKDHRENLAEIREDEVLAGFDESLRLARAAMHEAQSTDCRTALAAVNMYTRLMTAYHRITSKNDDPEVKAKAKLDKLNRPSNLQDLLPARRPQSAPGTVQIVNGVPLVKT